MMGVYISLFMHLFLILLIALINPLHNLLHILATKSFLAIICFSKGIIDRNIELWISISLLFSCQLIELARSHILRLSNPIIICINLHFILLLQLPSLSFQPLFFLNLLSHLLCSLSFLPLFLCIDLVLIQLVQVIFLLHFALVFSIFPLLELRSPKLVLIIRAILALGNWGS